MGAGGRTGNAVKCPLACREKWYIEGEACKLFGGTGGGGMAGGTGGGMVSLECAEEHEGIDWQCCKVPSGMS